jgi:hypothetical protein
MEYILLLLLVVGIAVIAFYKPVEKMTNKDLIATLKTFGEKGAMPQPKETTEEPIYGPKLPRTSAPTPSNSKGKADYSSVYPDIYGPEITPIPGQKKSCRSGKEQSDCTDGCSHEFNADFKNAFPNENGFQPYLGDFSKFQR